VQPSGPPCAAHPLVQPFGSLCCAGRPNVQLAGPPFSAARQKFMFFNWEHGSPARPARRPSV